MITLIVGKQNSGKSALAEKLALETGDEKIYYLATMKVMDKAGEERVERHRKQREGRGFITIEKQKDIAGVLDDRADASGSAVLLECVANLVSNEIFDGSDIASENSFTDEACEEIAKAVSREIRELSAKVKDLIIVTDEYEKDGEGYDDSTRFYVKTLSRSNELIKAYCDRVYDLQDKNGDA